MIDKKLFRIVLVVVSVAGAVAVYLATSAYGPGLSTDGARYLSTAESIAAGLGIIDYLGLPLTNWPPLYPTLLAAINFVTGIDVFVIGQFINVLAFGFIIWFSGIFFERSIPGNYLFALLATLVVATSLPFIEVSANIASDGLFMVCVLLFLLAAQNYARTRASRAWWAMVVVTLAACFVRYAGFTLIISGTLLILLVWRESWRQTILEAAKFGFASGLPIAAWAIFFNYRLTGSILGNHLPAKPWGNFVATIEKWAGWFLPESVLQIVPPLGVAAILLLIIALQSNRARWAAWFKRMRSSEILPSAIFYLIYGATLIFVISYPEHRVPGSQRLHVLLLPMFLVLATATAQEFLPTVPFKSKLARNVLLVVFALWLLFPLYRVQVHVRASLQNGDVSYYNLYNTRTLRESDIVAEIQSTEFSEDERVYSNNEAAAWFYLRRHIYRLPRYDAELGQNLEAIVNEFDGWPPADELATLIWFERDLDYKELVPTPDMLSEFIRLTSVFAGRYGNIYLMDMD
jgi:4-amino-4-deoxy-L-arabinose transferase-like glycosyltransferase